MLAIRNISKRFGPQTVVNNFSFETDKPGLYVLVGANGSGKSTLFNLISGLILMDNGQIELDGCTDVDVIRSRCGISTEPFVTDPSLTVNEIFAICHWIRKIPDTEILNWIEFWELNDMLNKPVKALSTGMKKRLSLALSLIANPDYLFWDEPFNGLDPIGIGLLNQLIVDLVDQGKTIFLSTHLLGEISFPKIQFLVMKDGLLVGQVVDGDLSSKDQVINLLK
jgi:ABC-type multidrug transport system ATPase subunit